MTLIIFVIFSLFFIYLSQKNFLWATAFIVAFLPTYLIRFKIGFLPLTLLELMILILFLVWLIKKKDKWSLGSFKYPIIFWLIIATVSVFISPNLHSASGIWKAYFIEPILFFLVFINVIKTTGSFANAQDDRKGIQNDNGDVILSEAPHLLEQKVRAEAKNPALDLIFLALGFSALYISLFAIWQIKNL